MRVTIIVAVFWTALFLGILTGCENVRQSIGISGKPLSRNFEENVKVNYKIIFGKVRPKEDDEDWSRQNSTPNASQDNTKFIGIG